MAVPDLGAFNMTALHRKGWVSVTIPTYNRAEMLHEALVSIADQSYRPIEIVLVDDGSSDGTQLMVEKFAADFVDSEAVLRFFRQDRQGPSPARSMALQACCGEYIQFLDSDDVLHPEKLRQQVAALQASAVDFVWSSSVKFTDVPDWNCKPFAGTKLDIRAGNEAIVPFIIKGRWRTESGLYRRWTRCCWLKPKPASHADRTLHGVPLCGAVSRNRQSSSVMCLPCRGRTCRTRSA